MLLESVHQVSKDWLETNTHSDAHITAVNNALGRDWIFRISSLLTIVNHGCPADQEEALFRLRRVLLGEDALHVDSSKQDVKDVLVEFHGVVRSLFSSSIMMLLGVSPKHGISYYGVRLWSGNGIGNMTVWRLVVKEGLDIFSYHFQNYVSTLVRLFAKAIFVERDAFGTRRRSDSYNTGRPGDAFLVVKRVEDETSTLIHASGNVHATRYTLAVAEIFGVEHSSTWVVVKRMSLFNGEYSVSSSAPQILRLDMHVRRVALIHVCNSRFSVNGNHMRHDPLSYIISEAQFNVIYREQGFPPHLG